MVRTTIRDVARQAGVSITTVSKALNDYSDVNPETRQKIKEIAEKLNYVPNAAGRSMGGKADKVIGLPAAANIGNIFLMRQFFMNFPHDVAEAAEIDGLNRYGVFFRIAMPLARPTIATTAIFGFMGFWNAFTAPILYIKTDTKYTLTLRPAELPVPERRYDVEPGHGRGLHLGGADHNHLPHLQQVFPCRPPYGRREIKTAQGPDGTSPAPFLSLERQKHLDLTSGGFKI